MSYYRVALARKAKAAAAARSAAARAPRAIQKKKVRFNASKAYKLSTPMKKLVSDVINSGKEDHWKMTILGQKILPFAPNVPTDVLSILPKIRQVGTDPGMVLADVQPAKISNREGKTIKLKSFTGRYDVYVNTDITSTGTFQGYKIRVLTLSCKQYPSSQDVLANWNAGSNLKDNLFLDHNADPYTWDGRPESYDLPVNRNTFTVHQDQKFVFKRGAIYNNTPTPPPTEGVGSAFQPLVHKTVHIKVPCKNRVIHYQASDDQLPRDFAPFVVVCYTTMSGNSSTAINNSLMIHGSSRLIWESTD